MKIRACFILPMLLALGTHATITYRENVAWNKTAVQSSTLDYNGFAWEAGFVLDGNVNFSVTCRCCSLTTGREVPWLEIDLGVEYNIGRIDVYGRSDVDYQLRQFDLQIGKTSTEAKTTQPVYTNRPTKQEYLEAHGHFIIVLGNTGARYIRIRNRYMNFNQLVICEVAVFEACEDYHFEPNCNQCHCNASPCNKATGLCPSVCEPGWEGPSCNITCEDGKFGIHCMETCHCMNPATCDKVTGECINGSCLFGWKGRFCNISTLVSKRKSVRMGTQHRDWAANRAVNGDIRTAADDCQCCAATLYKNFPWFEIDLRILYRIAHIVIYGRSDSTSSWQSFNGLRIFATKHYMTNGATPIFTSTETTFFLNITLNQTVVTRYITLQQVENRQMVICELQLFEGECEDGTFGRLCDNPCYCLDKPCDKETGQCPSTECLPGYQGDTCSKECDSGWFGSDCNGTCGFCINKSACDNIQGNCTACEPGYKGEQCKQRCTNGTFGEKCSSDCGQCKEKDTCDHVTGHCMTGCQPGYLGQLCNQSCAFGMFGENCSDNCGNCAYNQTCNVVNGHCGEDGCLEGYTKPFCVIGVQKQIGEKASLSTGSVAAILICGILVVLAILIVSIVVYRKRTKAEKTSKECFVDGSVVKDGNGRAAGDGAVSCAAAGATVNTDILDKDTKTTLKRVEFSADTPENIEYYEFAPRQDDIKVHKIWDYVHKGMANDCRIFYSEFETLKSGLQYECKTATETINRPKNRYREIYAYDKTRVKLSPSTNEQSKGDYVNASFVDGFEKVAKFIASQGPTKEMVDDFWRMIWEQESEVIVMLTNIYELGVQKCLQYWPIDEDPISFGNIVVKLLKEEHHADYVVRHLEIDNKYGNCRNIVQYHFTSWPDKTTPETTWSLVSFWRAVTNGCKNNTRPIVVHCSAGIGRTGTFIALDNLYHQARHEGCIRPLQMVETLRQQRVNMVQTKEQYVYMHEAVAEALLFGTHFLEPEQFEDMYSYLIKTEDCEPVSNMEKQFNLIEMSLQENESDQSDQNQHVLSQKHSDACKSGSETNKENGHEIESMYINVSESFLKDANLETDGNAMSNRKYLLNYRDDPTCLLLPLAKYKGKTKEIVDVIIKTGVQTIVQLQDELENMLIENSKEDDVELKLIEEKKMETLLQKDLILTYNERQTGVGATRNIRQFIFTDSNINDNAERGFVELMTEVQLWQPIITKETPVILVYSEGVRHEVFCAILNETMRIKNEDKVNIVETVKKIRQQNRAFISSFGQYKFCYDVIRRMLQSEKSEIYENVGT